MQAFIQGGIIAQPKRCEILTSQTTNRKNIDLKHKMRRSF